MKHKTLNEMHRDGKRENIKRFFGVVNQKMTGKKNRMDKRVKPSDVSLPCNSLIRITLCFYLINLENITDFLPLSLYRAVFSCLTPKEKCLKRDG